MSKKIFIQALFIILTSLTIFTSCWDKIELEDRSFINALGIDKYNDEDVIVFDGNKHKENNRFLISMILPSLDSLVSGNGDEIQEIKKSANETISASINLIDSTSGKKIYFGHTKVVCLGNELLKDEQLLKETIDALERNRDISRKIIVISTDETAHKILEKETDGKILLGNFISDYYKGSKDTVTGAFKQELESIIRSFRSTNNAIIPEISIKDKELKLGGATVIKNFKSIGKLNDEQTRGYLWVNGNPNDAQIIAAHENTYVPLNINSIKNKNNYAEENGKIVNYLEIKIEGKIEEFIFSEKSLFEQTDILTGKYKKAIEKEIFETDKFFKEHSMDGFNFKEDIRKRNHDLYLKYENDDKIFSNITIVPNIYIEITATGSIK